MTPPGPDPGERRKRDDTYLMGRPGEIVGNTIFECTSPRISCCCVSENELRFFQNYIFSEPQYWVDSYNSLLYNEL